MKRVLSLLLTLALTLGVLFALASCGAPKYVIETGKETGTYYGYTNMVATTINEKAGLGYKFSAVSSNGSKGNLLDLHAKKCDFAIVQNDVMSHAYNGTGDGMFDSTIKDFSAVGLVYQETVQIIAKAELDTNKDGAVTLDELKGKTVSIGESGSGVTINAKQILATADMDVTKDVNAVYYSVTDSTDKIKTGDIDAFFFTAGVPTAGITELFKTDDAFPCTVVTLTDAQASDLTGAAGSFYTEVELTHAQYDRIPEGKPVTAVAVSAVFVAGNDVPEDVVYGFTKALWENKSEYVSYTAQVAQMDVNAARTALGGVPVHPGALKYYKEVIPD